MPGTQSYGAGRPLRSDARRNRERILGAARAVIAEQGVDVALEEIIRRSGVGSATVYRNFGTRLELLDALFRERAEDLAGRAEELLAAPDPALGLAAWIREFYGWVSETRGVARSLVDVPQDELSPAHTCRMIVRGGGERLLERACAAGLAPGVTMDELITLVLGVALAADVDLLGTADPDRLVELIIQRVALRP